MCQLYARQHKTNNSYVDVLQARTCSGSIPWRNQTAILERWSIARARTDFTPKCITAKIVNKTIIIIISSDWTITYRTRFCIARHFFYIHYFHRISVDISFTLYLLKVRLSTLTFSFFSVFLSHFFSFTTSFITESLSWKPFNVMK